MKKIIYVTGGARSGKSSFALQQALTYQNRVFLATAEPFDDEMRQRISKHQQERLEHFTTIEEPLNLEQALKMLPSDTEVVLLDCLTVWTGNLMHHLGTESADGEKAIEEKLQQLLDVLRQPPCTIILVSNEVGMGIVPENRMARHFRDLAGTINQRVAAIATEAWLLCSGLPIRLK
uniref:Adenosylcobinamide kinase n=1 Tax=Chlorobium chlorochromatii (strain CaD3) TaxID=340177 RepID=Q3ASB4_CHLCH